MNKASTSADRHKAAQGLTLQIHLTAGNWSGIVLADAPSRNARVLSTPRSLLRDFVSLEELLGSGVYVLTGPDPESSFGIRSYIGESDHVGERIRSHARGKSFWSRAYVAVAKDRWLSKSHVRFLESRLMQEAARAPLISSVTNDRSEREYDRLPEGDVANLEGYIDLLRIMLPAIGCPLFSFPHLDFRPGGQAAQVFPLTVPDDGTAFELRKGEVFATGYFKDGSFWVCKGSTARIEEQSSLRDGYRKTRRELVQRGVMRSDALRGVFVFEHDAPFGSPSDAAAVVGATSLNGRKEWRVRGSRMTFGEWERARPEQPAP